MKAKAIICATMVAATAAAATYKVDLDRPDGIYRCGETATFTVRLLDKKNLVGSERPFAVLDNFGTTVFTNMPLDVSSVGAVFKISGTLREPGFLRLSLPPTRKGGKDPFVFSAGFEPEKIQKGSPSPEDFDAFWADARARLAREVPLDAQMTRVSERSTKTFDFYRISFATFGRRVHGYMSVPKDKSKAPFPVDFEVNAAGFGSWTNDMAGRGDAICVRFSVYPFAPDWKWHKIGLEAKYKEMDAALAVRFGAPRYCQAGITESREDYFFYPVILGIDRAVDWVASRPDVDKTRFRYQGTSQGGGFGFYLCGLNHTFTRAAFYVPAITDTMGYLKGRQSGWPQVVENNSSTPARRAAAERWAPYFDGANFASRIMCPVRVAVGFSDTTCPPCAVYAAYNEIKVKDKAIGNGLGMTHSCRQQFYSKFDKWVRSAERNAWTGLYSSLRGESFTAHPMITRDGRRMISRKNNAGETVYELVPTNRLPANLPPIREWKLYGLKATHTDIGLHNSQYIQRHGSVRRIDEAARLIDADKRSDDDPAAYRYVMEGMWFWDNYHQDKGMDAAWRIVTNYMARGRMDVGVMCAGNHTHLYSATEIDRSTLTKRLLEQKWGIHTRTFLMPDNPGLSCSLIDPYVRAGVRYCFFAPNQWNPIPSTIWKRNTSIAGHSNNPDTMGGGNRVEVSYDSPLPMVFRWKAPGGKESLLMWCSTHYGYGYRRLGLTSRVNPSFVSVAEERMPEFLEMLEKKYPYDVWLAGVYEDDEWPNAGFADFAAKWNEKWLWPQFRTVGRLDEPFDLLEKKFGDKIPTLTGEMTSGWLQHAASTPELLADKLNIDRKLETAERLGTFAGTIDRGAVDRAWWHLILNDEHSYGTSGYKGRRVFETWMQHRDWIERAASTASNELAKAVAKLGLKMELFTNDDCHNCSQITNIHSTLSTRSTCSTRLNNPRICRDGVTENRWYRVAVTNGVLYSIYDKELKRELIDGPANRFMYTRNNHKTWEAEPEKALGAKVTRRVYLAENEKRIDIEDRFEHAHDLFNTRRYYRFGYLAFPFAVPGGAFRAHLNGTVIRPYEDCHPMTTDAYCAVRDWCLVENADFGVALMMRDSTLTEFGEIHPDKTCYTGKPPKGKTAIYPYLFTDWLQMHQPDGDSMNFTFRFAITSYAKGGRWANVARMCEDWLDPYAKWMREQNIPRFSRESVEEPPPGWTGLIEKPRAGHGEKDGQMYILWGAEMSPAFDHYELWRDGKFLANVTNEVHNGLPYRVARYEDLGLPTHSRHEYRIRKVWKGGRKDPFGEPFYGLTRYVHDATRDGVTCDGEQGRRMDVRYDGKTVTSWRPVADFISVEGPVPEVNRGGCSTAVFVRPVTNRAAVVSAKWTVTGLGVFRVFLNGAEVGAEDFLKPGYTHPRKRRSSFSYDVTDAFRRDPGARNVLCAEVSTGWWRDGIVGRAGKVSAFQGVLKLAYADGSAEEIVSDTSWRAAYAGPLRHATIWGGERYDARVPAPWRTTGDVRWKRARVNTEFKGAVTPLEGRSVRVRRDLAFAPRDAWAWKGADGAAKDRHGRARILRRYAGGEALVLEPGETLVVDFGQNCAGVPEFTARAAAGTELSGHPAEMLNDANGERSRGNDGPAGSAYFANYRTAESRLRYVFAGGDGETWHPSCTFFGGRYWSFTANGRVEFKRLSLLPVMSIAPEDETGTIVTGDASLNRLISNCLWGMRSNYLSVPTDCPQRNERWGWTGDTQVFAGAAVYAADVYGFLSKWMTDMRDSQADERTKCPGMFAKVAPGMFGGRLIGWADAGVIVPYTLWRQYGDVACVNANWDAMARFMANLDKSNWTTPENERQCVDWLSPAMYEGHRRGWGSRFCKNPFWDGETNADERQYWDMLGACYHIWDLKMMVEMAKATGRDKEAAAYAQREAKAVARYRNLFLDHHGRFAERYRNMQTPNLFALKLGLFPTQAATDAAKADLVASVKAGNCKVGTGFLGTPLLLDVIADIVGDPALAYSVLLQRDCPGWLYSVDNGATTIWERWDGYTKERGFGPPEMNSFNHYANGAVLGWMFRTMAGIRPGKEAGYRHFTLVPKPDPRVGSCKASYRTKYGTVKSEWRYVDGGKLEWSFTVPPGTTATIIPPDGGPAEACGPGSYQREYAGTGQNLKISSQRMK